VFDDLGLSRSEASALKVKATLLDAPRGNRDPRLYAEGTCWDSRRVPTFGEQPGTRKDC